MKTTTKTMTTESKFSTIDKILMGCAAFLLVFTVIMIIIFFIYQQEPTTLITSVFSVLGGEITLSFAIWYIKKRYAHKYEEEDKEDGRLQGTDEN